MTQAMREVIHEKKFDEELLALEPSAKRADEFVRGAINQISRMPHSGKRRDESKNVWGLAITDHPDHPPVVLYYTFNRQYIWLLSIRISDHDPDIELL